jgi:dihydroorotase
MKTLIKNATITSKGSALNGKKKDILIVNGIIEKIEDSITDAADETIQGENLHVSTGWFDMTASFCDPGYEHKETIESGINAAMAGGFTGVGLLPETSPVVSGKSQVEYIRRKSENKSVEIVPYGSLSVNFDGENLSEYYDMYLAGARAFTDGFRPVNSELLSRALMYSKNSGGLIMVFPNDKALSKGGQMHEGIESTKLGMKGIPAIAEELQVNRDIQLAEFNQSTLHFLNVSTKESVEAIRKAKKLGTKITAQVAVANLLLDDTSLKDFDSNYKVLPVLRSKEHIEALIDGLADGTIDCIASSHVPQDIESKDLEFEHAEFGIIGLETAFAVARTATQKKLKLEDLIEKFTTQPRKLLSLQNPEIKKGEKVNLTIFNPDEKWTFTAKDIKSKSKNTPFVGRELVGRVVKVVR